MKMSKSFIIFSTIFTIELYFLVKLLISLNLFAPVLAIFEKPKTIHQERIEKARKIQAIYHYKWLFEETDSERIQKMCDSSGSLKYTIDYYEHITTNK